MIDLKFTINRGDFTLSIDEQFEQVITGIYGPSGAGKTTLLKIVAGLLKPSSGIITVDGEVLVDTENKVNVPIEKRQVAYMFQEGRLFPHLTVEQNLRYGIKHEQKAIIPFDEVVDLLEIGIILNNSISSISGGQSQRVALGRALLSSPKLLLMDEPFSSLDHRLRKQIIPYLIEIQNRTQIPILVVSHDLGDLLSLSNRLCIISQGRVVAHGVYQELQKDSSLAVFLGINY